MMYKNEYELKMKELLNDKNTYKTIRNDPTQKLMRNTIINNLYKQRRLDAKQKFQLTSAAANAPRLYGLPKIHKPHAPLRPICSFVNVPCYKLSKFVGSILENIISEDLNIKSSLQLKEKINNFTIQDYEILISFDVVSLFTNIPIHLAIRTIMRKWEKLETHTQIDKKQFQTILDFCLRDNNYFSYNNTLYQQIYGMPMGNPLTPTIADIVLDKLLDDSLAELKSKDIYVKYITKYVDDIFAIFKVKDVEDILTVFNAQHTKIQFTKELEQNNKVAFIDVEIHRKNQNLTFNWYAKPMASGRIIKYHSNHAWKQKINTATSLIRKIHLISDGDFIEENKKKIKNILFKNSYPHTLIEKLIINTIQEMDHPNSSNGQTEANTNKLELPTYPD
ncbi:uncharacterized protein [Eurosta solidaginis]|uniref:uncharacterized protein n=1 Tax=Eurosta solidaginis TaxID=178769 RepID=UPI0035309602